MCISNAKNWLGNGLVKMANKPNWRRLLMLKLVLLAFLSLLGVLYAAFWLDEPIISHHFYRRPQYSGKSDIRLQQNGDYWVYNNFIKAKPLAAYNSTITLTTHGTYMDFKNLEQLVVRWEAPISMTLYTNDNDFEATLLALCHLKYCYLARYFRYISVHLVIHNQHFPANFRPWSEDKPVGFKCKYATHYERQNQNETYWYKRGLPYPINLLRNVARLNAATHYVFAIDSLLLPAQNFVNCLLKFLKTFAPPKPLKTVFCVPIFPQLSEGRLPRHKSELFHELYPYIVALPDENLPLFKQVMQLHFWLYKHIKDGEMSVYSIAADSLHCNAYVSVNTLEPFYDQRIQESIYDNQSTRLKLLKHLQYDFVLLDGTFLIKRLTDTWRNIIDFPPIMQQDQEKAILELAKLYSLTLWFPHHF